LIRIRQAVSSPARVNGGWSAWRRRVADQNAVRAFADDAVGGLLLPSKLS
jgi:hypothetical protein